MKLVRGKKLIVHTSEGRRHAGRSVCAALVGELHGAGIRAAAVLRATAGYGPGGRLATTMSDILSADLPVIVEAIDTPERIDAVLPSVVAIAGDDLVEVRDVEIAEGEDVPSEEA